MRQIDLDYKTKVAWNQIPSNFAYLGHINPTHHLGKRCVGSTLPIKPKLLGIKFRATFLFLDMSIRRTVYVLACTHARKIALALISKVTKKYPLGHLCTDPVLVIFPYGIVKKARKGSPYFVTHVNQRPEQVLLENLLAPK